MTRRMKTTRVLVLAGTLGIAAPALAATIYGTLQQNNQPLQNVEVRLACGGGDAPPTRTDQRGTYRLTVNRTGRCTLEVEGASAPVALYDDPTRYNFELTHTTDGKAHLQPR